MTTRAPAAGIRVDPDRQTVWLATASRSLELRLSYCGRCVIDGAKVLGREVIDASSGVWTGFKRDGKWTTTRSGLPNPKVAVSGRQVAVEGIGLGVPGVTESWRLTLQGDAILWTIKRRYPASLDLEDTAQPLWSFPSMSTWTGAILGTGGVAWCKLFDAPNASYGVHTDSAAFWKAGDDACLEIRRVGGETPLALRFSREPSAAFSLAFEPSGTELAPRSGLARFSRSGQDIWAPFVAARGDVEVTYELRARRAGEAFGRGQLEGIDGNAVGEILNTIGRIGVIDDGIMGSNGWYSGYAVLHEPWIARMGLAIDDPNYTRNMARALDRQRDFAIMPDGMVKSRWAYGNWDAEPGTYDVHGFYECQWGRLMDTQPSYVINVAEQFDQSGDKAWVRAHKASCEAALGYLLRRDTNGNGLVEMATDSQTQRKASDWLDVIWASFENAFVNAQMYRALILWADVEGVLGDRADEREYLARAARLKTAFNRTTRDGGFWDPDRRWYVYWRERDGTVRGNNLTLPVNFMAIAYGLCDDPARKRAILDEVEAGMAREKLFCWPANIYTFLPGETDRSDFPNYENGDIFLAWAEAGIAAYAPVDPVVALKYVRNILARYAKDGLAFQRYLRKDQSGAGDDILANNCSAVVGLYRDIYGIRPKHDRLYLDPHLTADLDGTVVRYLLRGTSYDIALSRRRFEVAAAGWKLRSQVAFACAFGKGGFEYFAGEHGPAVLSAHASFPLDVSLLSWGAVRKWSVAAAGAGKARFIVRDLAPGAECAARIGSKALMVRADDRGAVSLEVALPARAPVTVSLRRAP